MLLVVALLLPAPAADAAAPSGGRLGKDGWAARQVSKGRVLERDRALLEGLPGSTRLGYHPQTRRVRFLSGTRARPLGPALTAVASGKRRMSMADARSRARRFIDRYGGLFGLATPERELRVSQARRQAQAPSSVAPGTIDPAPGRVPFNVTVRFDQVRAGLPVMGGQIVVQVSEQGEVLSAAGEVLPSDARVATKPRLAAAEARAIASTWLARQAGRPQSDVVTRSEGLALYDPRVMGDPFLAAIGARPVWRIDASLPARGRQAAQRRLVVVDARGGEVLTTIGRIYSVDRIICDNQDAPGRSFRCNPPFARSEGQAITGVSDVDTLYRLMGVVDDYLASRFGRLGLDGNGARLKATVRHCGASGCPWQGAEWKWAEQQAIFGRGWARADDIVAHELTHGLLDHTVPLFYFHQSGAINESLADIFGELIDLSYPGGRDTAAMAWKIGEDTPIGAIRDMQDPTRFGHPDRVRSPQWYKGTADDGGVHRNSGVGNKAAALIADGGSFSGYDIVAIGRTRAARVFYQALTTRLTPAANYIDLADALVAACTDLVGIDGFTLAHCVSVRDATLATQMHLEPRRLAPRQAPLCATGKRPIDIFVDDLEGSRRGQLEDPAPVAWQEGLVLPPESEQQRGLGWHLGLQRQAQLLRAGLRSQVGHGHAQHLALADPRRRLPAFRAWLLVRPRCQTALRRWHRGGQGRRWAVATGQGAVHARRLQRPHRHRLRQRAGGTTRLHRQLPWLVIRAPGPLAVRRSLAEGPLPHGFGSGRRSPRLVHR